MTGASSGIGAEFVPQLSAQGYDLVLIARRVDRIEKLNAELSTTAHVLDCDPSVAAQLVAAKLDALGTTVSLRVNDAGFGTHGKVWEIDSGRDAERLNCKAVVTRTRDLLPGAGRAGALAAYSHRRREVVPGTVHRCMTRATALGPRPVALRVGERLYPPKGQS